MIGASILYDGGDARATRALPGASSVTGRYGLHSWATDLSVGYALAMANDWTLKVCEQSEPCVTGTEVIDRRRKPASLIGVDNPPDVSHLAHPLVFGKLEHQSLRIEADTMSCRQRRPDTSVGFIDGVRHDVDRQLRGVIRRKEPPGQFDRLDPARLVELVDHVRIDAGQHLPGGLPVRAADKGFVGEDRPGPDVDDWLKRHCDRHSEGGHRFCIPGTPSTWPVTLIVQHRQL
jgi:hypothetical protein